MQDFSKYWPSLAILFAGLIVLIATYVTTRRNDDQSERIEDYGKLNNALSNSIKELGEKNNEITKNIQALTEQNKKQIDENIKLSKISKHIIENVEQLSKSSAELSKQVNENIQQNIFLSNENQKLIKNNNELNEKIFSLNKAIKDLNTGGSSYPQMRHCQITLYHDGHILGHRLHLSLEMYNTGEYPLDNIKIRGYQLIDFRKTDPTFLWTELSMSGLNIHSRFANFGGFFKELYNEKNHPVISSDFEVLKPGQRVNFDPFFFKESFEYYGINIFVESKRQDWIILLRLYRPNNSTDPFAFQAHKIMRVGANGLENISEYIDSGFSTGENNKHIWFNTDLPKEWFSNNK